MRKFIAIIFIIFGLIFVYFSTCLVNEKCRTKDGYNFGYEEKFSPNEIYGLKRVGHNFSHFFQYWQSPGYNQRLTTLKKWLTSDGNSILNNLSHFVFFLIFSLILLIVFKFSQWQVLIIGLFINIFHEYIIEGRFSDPSFIDLWIDTLAILIGLSIFSILTKNLRINGL